MRGINDFTGYRASLIVVDGGGTGEEHELAGPRWLVGRGPGVDVAIDDAEMAPRHSRIEFVGGRFLLATVDSEAVTRVNGADVSECELRHGDRIAMGGHVFQILIERRNAEPLYG